jgi:hypothetical protein
MTKMTQRVLFLLLPLLSLPLLARCQNVPAVTTGPVYQGFAPPDAGGVLTYGITGSESGRTGYNSSGTVWNSTISGDVGYLSKSVLHPFSAVYSGGYLYSNSGDNGEPSTFYQNLVMSQVFQLQRWNIVVADALRYLPESPSVGLSGIPGVGDVGVPPIQTTPDQGQDILSNFAARVTNTASGTASHQITGSTAFQGSGEYSILRFVGAAKGGLDGNLVSGSGGINHRITALSSVNGSYEYAYTSYPDLGFSFVTQTLTAGYAHQFNRRLSVSASAGPQFTSSSDPTLPGHTSLSAAGSVGYAGEATSLNLGYVRGIRTGSGVVVGGLTESVSLSHSRRFGRSFSISSSVSYTRQDSSPALTSVPFTTETVAASFQASRAIGRHLSGYVSYTILDQTLQGSATSSNGFSGTSQIGSIGITYSPRPIHLGH